MSSGGGGWWEVGQNLEKGEQAMQRGLQKIGGQQSSTNYVLSKVGGSLALFNVALSETFAAWYLQNPIFYILKKN